MNKLLIPSIIVALLVAAGAFYFLSTQPKQRATTTTTTTQTAIEQEASPTPASVMTSLKELMTGGSQTCTYSTQIDGGGITAGTVYVSDGKMRSDFSITGEENTTIDGSMITDGEYMYTWSSAQPQGIKIAITDEMKNAAPTDATAGQAGIDLDQKIDYRCQPWVTDQSKFTPPTTITFTEMQLPPSDVATGSGVPTSAELCSACDDLEGEQQSACLTALKCN